jgi:hypothetical protein
VGAIDFVDGLARLLTNAETRRRFFEAPEAVVAALDVRPEDRLALIALDREELEAQAQTLLEKRLHEAVPLFPVTWSNLGDRGRSLFLRCAEEHWPPEHSRPVRDAARFCRLLSSRGEPAVHPPELHRLEFLASRCTWSVRLLRFHVEGKAKRTVLHGLFRRPHGRVEGIALYFAL